VVSRHPSYGAEKIEPKASVGTNNSDSARGVFTEGQKAATNRTSVEEAEAAEARKVETDAKVMKLQSEVQVARDQSEKLQAEAQAVTKASEASVKASEASVKVSEASVKVSEASAEKLKAEMRAVTKASDSEARSANSKFLIYVARALGLTTFLLAGGYSVRFVSFKIFLNSCSSPFIIFCFEQYYVRESNHHNSTLVYKKLVC
jgi:hypothetical protein